MQILHILSCNNIIFIQCVRVCFIHLHTLTLMLTYHLSLNSYFIIFIMIICKIFKGITHVDPNYSLNHLIRESICFPTWLIYFSLNHLIRESICCPTWLIYYCLNHLIRESICCLRDWFIIGCTVKIYVDYYVHGTGQFLVNIFELFGRYQ